METSKLIGILLVLTGIGDLAIAHFMGPRIAPPARLAMRVFGILFLLLGLAVATNLVRLT